jgi:hypothetical protein
MLELLRRLRHRRSDPQVQAKKCIRVQSKLPIVKIINLDIMPNLAVLSLRYVSFVLILLNDALILELPVQFPRCPKSQKTICDRMKCAKNLPAISAYYLHPLHMALLPVAWLDLNIFHWFDGSLGPHTNHHHTYP